MQKAPSWRHGFVAGVVPAWRALTTALLCIGQCSAQEDPFSLMQTLAEPWSDELIMPELTGSELEEWTADLSSSQDLSLLSVESQSQGIGFGKKMWGPAASGGAAILKKDQMGQPGFHLKLLDAQPRLQQNCSYDKIFDALDCNRALKLMEFFVSLTSYPEPANFTHEALVKSMLGLHYWLYAPGSQLAFAFLDENKNGLVTEEEMRHLFGNQVIDFMMASGLWPYMDADRDGNMTKVEAYEYVKAGILMRHVLPQLDSVDPTAPTTKCLNMAKRLKLDVKIPPKPLNKYKKLLCIYGIMMGAVALHCLLCVRTPKGAKDTEKP